MRCKICDTQLTNSESVKRDTRTGYFTDICGSCDGVIYDTLRSYEYSTELEVKKVSDKG